MISKIVSMGNTIGKYSMYILWSAPLRWRHNGRDSVSNHQSHGCLLNRLFRRRSEKTSKLHVTSFCAGNSPGTGEFPAQMASNAENVFHLMTSSWHVMIACCDIYPADHGWGLYFVIWTQIGMWCKAGTVLHIQWNAKHLSMLVDNNCLFGSNMRTFIF